MKNQIELSENSTVALIVIITIIASVSILLGLGYFFEDSFTKFILIMPIFIAIILYVIVCNVQDGNITLKLSSIGLYFCIMQFAFVIVYYHL